MAENFPEVIKYFSPHIQEVNPKKSLKQQMQINDFFHLFLLVGG